MARFRCRACGDDGTFDYDGRRACPNCGSRDVQFALSILELADDDPLIVALTRMTDDSTYVAQEHPSAWELVAPKNFADETETSED